MNRIYNVLVFPGGTEIGLEINRALSQCKEVRLYSGGLEVSNHAPYVYARHFVIPSIYSPTWIDDLNRIILEKEIDYIFPAYDDVIVALVKNQERIRARIVSSPLETCLITRSKSETYYYLSNVLPTPECYENIEVINEYPVFVKPDKGQGSQHTHIVKSREDLAHLRLKEKKYIITEYLPGDEYTVDCFSDRDAGLLFCGGRIRIRTKSGISMNSRIFQSTMFEEYGRAISMRLKFHGAWFFQVKKDQKGVFKLLEVAPRIAGTMALYRVLGVNFPLLSIYEQERIQVEIMVNKIDIEIDRALVNRYKHQINYSAVYVDLDDTLIINDNINTNLIKFLYQCINSRIRVVLLTKHGGKVGETLNKCRMSNIFDEIIHVGESDNKSDYIREDDAILIDDSFRERRIIKDKLGILTFDCSMIEMLLDDRA